MGLSYCIVCFFVIKSPRNFDFKWWRPASSVLLSQNFIQYMYHIFEKKRYKNNRIYNKKYMIVYLPSERTASSQALLDDRKTWWTSNSADYPGFRGANVGSVSGDKSPVAQYIRNIPISNWCQSEKCYQECLISKMFIFKKRSYSLCQSEKRAVTSVLKKSDA